MSWYDEKKVIDYLVNFIIVLSIFFLLILFINYYYYDNNYYKLFYCKLFYHINCTRLKGPPWVLNGNSPEEDIKRF